MITDELAELIKTAVLRARDAGEFAVAEADIPPLKLETPKNKQHGDYSSNVALALKKATGVNDSRALANSIVAHLPENALVDHADIAGPGFLNFYLKPDWLHNTLLQIEAEDTCYGTNDTRHGEKILIEFVSANPTGPISVVNGRAAALGDVLANLLASQGCEVGREFYINDALNSTQLDLFGYSVYLRYLQLQGQAIKMQDGTLDPGVPETDAAKSVLTFPENGYQGVYVKEIAKEILAEVGGKYNSAPEAERTEFFRNATLQRMVESQKAALAAFGLHFDTWYFESSLYEKNLVEQTIARLKERGYAYEKDGALWLQSTAFGDDKDRVLIRSNEKATYIAADAAYHDNKFQRGYTRSDQYLGAQTITATFRSPESRCGRPRLRSRKAYKSC